MPSRLNAEVAQAVMRVAKFEPLVPYPGNRRPWLCRCLTCGSEVAPYYMNVQQGRRGCATCKSATLRSLRTTPDDLAVHDMKAASLEPLEAFPGANNPWHCQCARCGKRSTPTLTKIRTRGGACKWCARNSPVDPDAAESVMRAVRLEPQVPFPGANTRWHCRCLDCGVQVFPTYTTVRIGGGCRACGTRGGFKPGKPAIVYLISHETLNVVKVGIGNVDADRLDRHRRNGWQVVAVVRVSGELAPVIERNILDWWRTDLGLPPFLSASEMPRRGWTETVDADGINIPATVERMRALARATPPKVA